MKKGWISLNMILILLIGFSAISLTGCEKRLQTITVTELITPPEALLEPCDKPEVYHLETNEDLVRLASAAILGWEQCAAKMEAIRTFYRLSETKKSEKNSEKKSE